MHRGLGAARRATRAISHRIRGDADGVARGVGVGDDESSFGGQRARVWFEEWMEEARERLLALFEHSVFERVPGLQKWARRFLGRTSAPTAPPMLPPKRPTGPLGAHTPGGQDADRAYIRRRMLDAHMSEHAGLRDAMAKARAADEDPDPN